MNTSLIRLGLAIKTQWPSIPDDVTILETPCTHVRQVGYLGTARTEGCVGEACISYDAPLVVLLWADHEDVHHEYRAAFVPETNTLFIRDMCTPRKRQVQASEGDVCLS